MNILGRIELHFLPGSELVDCAAYAQRLAMLLREEVIFRFNGQLLAFASNGAYTARALTEKEMAH